LALRWPPGAAALSLKGIPMAAPSTPSAQSPSSANSVQSSHASGKGLADLLEHGLKDMYYAEKKIYKSLPKMIKAAQHQGLKDALNQHREETLGHVEMLERAFEVLGKRARSVKCEAIDGILEEAEDLMGDFGGTAAGDAAIIFSAQAVEHYEITRYGSLRTFAELLGLNDVAQILSQIESQEEAADEKLTKVAEGGVNQAAVQGNVANQKGAGMTV